MVKVKLQLKGLNKIMRSDPVQAELNARAARVAAAAGPKYRITPRPHKYTARTFVEPKPGETVSDADNLRLLRAIDAARR